MFSLCLLLLSVQRKRTVGSRQFVPVVNVNVRLWPNYTHQPLVVAFTLEHESHPVGVIDALRVVDVPRVRRLHQHVQCRHQSMEVLVCLGHLDTWRQPLGILRLKSGPLCLPQTNPLSVHRQRPFHLRAEHMEALLER